MAHSKMHSLTLLSNHLHSSPSNIHLLLTPSTLPSILKACTYSPSSLPFALQLHSFLLKTNLISHPITLNSLLSAYSKHSNPNAARKLFDEMPFKDHITYNSMLNCYTQHGLFAESITVFNLMCFLYLYPKPELVAAVVSLCGQVGDLSLGRAMHGHAVVRAILEHSLLLPTSLIDMYSKCSELDASFRVFGAMRESNVVTWTAMINGCVTSRSYGLSIDLFRRMGIVEGIQPNRATMLAVLPACAELGVMNLGKEIHGFAFRHGFVFDSRVISGLISMYGKFDGGIRHALLVFERAEEKDTVTWSSAMAATSKYGDHIKTFEIFGRMRRVGSDPNSITTLAIIDACTNFPSMTHGRAVLGYLLKSGIISDVIVGNSLINLFAKSGCLESSSRVFNELVPVKDSVSYTTMIQSYGFHGRGREALRLFKEMKEMGYGHDDIAILAILSACSHSGLIEEGKEIFDSLNGDCSAEHYACYVDLLGRGGRIEEACEVVRKMPIRLNSRMLSSLVSACKVHGKFEMAEELAQKLINLEPENSANYTLMSTIHGEHGDWERVEESRRAMVEKGLRKNLSYSRIDDRNWDVLYLYV